jgi:predicted ArsR family transcriptional regulator
MAFVRTSEDQIANVLGIDPKTLRKYFSVELKRGAAKGEVNLRQKAYRIADNGDERMMRYLLDKIDAKQNRGYHENGSEGPSISAVHAKLATLLARRAEAAQFQKQRAEQLSLSSAEAEVASDTDPGTFYRAPKPD